jgi:hypothetical protein
LGEVEDRSSRAGGDGGGPAASVKSATATVACVQEREREEEEADTGFKYELVAPQQMTRLVDTSHKMTGLSAAPSAVARLSCPSPRGTTSAPLVAPVRLTQLLHKSRQTQKTRFKKNVSPGSFIE